MSLANLRFLSLKHRTYPQGRQVDPCTCPVFVLINNRPPLDLPRPHPPAGLSLRWLCTALKLYIFYYIQYYIYILHKYLGSHFLFSHHYSDDSFKSANAFPPILNFFQLWIAFILNFDTQRIIKSRQPSVYF